MIREFDTTNMIITHDDNGNKLLVSEDVRFRLTKSKDSIFRMEVRKEANGGSFKQAKETAEGIVYDYAIEGNTMNLKNYLTASGDSKFIVLLYRQ